MKRVIAIALVLTAAIAFVGLSTAATDAEKGLGEYKVELDNAFGLIEGGDFKVAGVRAGKITSLEVDKRTKRAVVGFEVTEQGFGSLRTDARCEVMPQSLVGEYFVNCEPGESAQKLAPGDMIPVERTASTVPPDLVANIYRRPRAERLRLIINELGAAVAGNADNLNAAIRRASPALRETNRVLAILADQNQVLADLARDADRVVGELSDNRRDIARWVVEARDTATASAERDEDIARGFERLPRFLEELEPTMVELGRTVERQGPALQSLAGSADQIEQLFENIPPFARANRPGLRALGRASETGREAVKPAQETVRELNRYAEGVPELGKNLAIILEHLDDREQAIEADPRSPGGKGYTGLEALLTYVFDQTLAINLHDGNTHILQAQVFEGECAPYADRKAAKELAEMCGRFLGPNVLGVTSRDPTQPPGWDEDDHGPEEFDQSVRRRAVRAAGDPGRRVRRESRGGRRDAGRAGGGSGERGRSGGGGPGGSGDGGPSVRLPRLDDILPGGGGGADNLPDPPAVKDLPNVGTSRDDAETNEQLMNFLLGS